jgi:hypothetical protein
VALDATALTLVATAEDELGVSAGTETARLERYIHAATAAILQYLNRPAIHYATGIVDSLPGFGTQRLLLSRYPVTSLTSVVIDGTTLASDDYEIDDAAAGIVYRRYGFASTGMYCPGIVQEDILPGTEQRLITVTYTAGYVTPQQVVLNGALTRSLPYDIELACLQTVAVLRGGRGRDWSVASESLGAASVSYGGMNTAIGRGMAGIIPDTAAALLSPYRRLVL